MTKLVMPTFEAGPERPCDLPTDTAGWVAFDTETCALHPDDTDTGQAVSVVSVAYRTRDDRLWSVAYPFAQGREYSDKLRGPNLTDEAFQNLITWLCGAGVGLMAHNIKFDLLHMSRGVMAPVGYRGWDLSYRRLLDTAVAAKEVWPHDSMKLKEGIGVKLWGEDVTAEKAALKKHLGPQTNPRYDRVPWEIMQPYAARDAELCFALGDLLLHRAEEGEINLDWLWREHRVMRALLRMEQLGLPYPRAESEEIAAELERRLADRQAQLPFKVKDAAKYFFGSEELVGPTGAAVQPANLRPYSVTPKTGKPQFTTEVLDRMVEDGVPFARELAEVKKAQTAHNLWYTGYAARTGLDGRLRTVFRQVASARGDSGGTASGRFSVERVNLQAIPHDYRLTGSLLAGLPTPRALIGKAAAQIEGTKLWELDLAQAELRVAAMMAGCRVMLDLIAAGADLHGRTATELFGIGPDAPNWYQMRTVAKRANFSGIFGVGGATFRGMVRREAGVDYSLREADRIIEGWRSLYPEYQAKLDEDQGIVQAHRKIPLANGRFRYYRWGEDSRSAFNQRVQGSLAEMNKDWLLATDRLMHEADLGIGSGLGLLLSIHDSMVLLLPDNDYGEHLVDCVVRAGIKAWDNIFPEIGGGVDVAAWKS